MTKAQHTPGPWQIYEDGPDTFVMTGKLPSYPSYNICHVQNHNQRADAALIVSAPDLLAALECEAALDMPFDEGQAIFAKHGYIKSSRQSAHEWVRRKSVAAITKATGVL